MRGRGGEIGACDSNNDEITEDRTFDSGDGDGGDDRSVKVMYSDWEC